MEVLSFSGNVEVKNGLNGNNVMLWTADEERHEVLAGIWGWKEGDTVMVVTSPNFAWAVLVKEGEGINGPKLKGIEIKTGSMRFEDRSALFWDLRSGRGVYMYVEGAALVAVARKYGDLAMVRVTR